MADNARLTRDEIMRLEGIGLDLAIAEQVMGWTWEDTEDGPTLVSTDAEMRQGLLRAYNPKWQWPASVRRDTRNLAPYSEYIEFAWLALARTKTPGRFRLSHGASEQWWTSFGGPACQGNTAPEAVARAVLCDVMGV